MENLIWVYFAGWSFIGGVLKNYSTKPLAQWSWQRRLYFLSWSVICAISTMNALRFFVHNPTFNFCAQFALGILFVLVAFMPCGIGIFNRLWFLRRLREVVFISGGMAQFFLAFRG